MGENNSEYQTRYLSHKKCQCLLNVISQWRDEGERWANKFYLSLLESQRVLWWNRKIPKQEWNEKVAYLWNLLYDHFFCLKNSRWCFAQVVPDNTSELFRYLLWSRETIKMFKMYWFFWQGPYLPKYLYSMCVKLASTEILSTHGCR